MNAAYYKAGMIKYKAYANTGGLVATIGGTAHGDKIVTMLVLDQTTGVPDLTTSGIYQFPVLNAGYSTRIIKALHIIDA